MTLKRKLDRFPWYANKKRSFNRRTNNLEIIKPHTKCVFQVFDFLKPTEHTDESFIKSMFFKKTKTNQTPLIQVNNYFKIIWWHLFSEEISRRFIDIYDTLRSSIISETAEKISDTFSYLAKSKKMISAPSPEGL